MKPKQLLPSAAGYTRILGIFSGKHPSEQTQVSPPEKRFGGRSCPLVKSHTTPALIWKACQTNQYKGLMAHAEGSLDQAEATSKSLSSSDAREDNGPNLPGPAPTTPTLGDDHDAARRSLAISSEPGMRPLIERVLSRREILGAL